MAYNLRFICEIGAIWADQPVLDPETKNGPEPKTLESVLEGSTR